MTDLTPIKETWRQRARHWWYDFEWPVVGGLALAAMLLGCVGFHLHLGRGFNPVDLLYKSAQLFFLQINVEPPMPWQLNAARVLAPMVAGYTALQALAELFAKQMLSFRLRFLRGHVVICGLGRKGLVLARGFLERGQAVVVIERDEENDYVRQCRDIGGVVMIGDATEPWLLGRARITRAAHLFAICGDDGVNAEVAVRAAQLVDGRPGAPLTCRVHIFDPELCSLLRERELDAGSSGRLRLEFFNVYDLGARVLLEENPLGPAGGAGGCDHLIIVGVGRLGESLVANAARQWRGIAGAGGARLRVTLVDHEARAIADKLMVRHPILRSACDWSRWRWTCIRRRFRRRGS
ncbi:MAG: NAD(P)-binding protein [Kiritimatiellia bacterium]